MLAVWSYLKTKTSSSLYENFHCLPIYLPDIAVIIHITGVNRWLVEKKIKNWESETCKVNATADWAASPWFTPLRVWVFKIFPKMEGMSELFIKRELVGKIGGCSKKGGILCISQERHGLAESN